MLKKIINIIGWIVVLLAFGALGLNSDDKTFGFFLYLGFFAIVFGLVYLYLKKHHRKTESDPKVVALIRKISGIVLFIIAIFSPIVAFKKIQLPFLPNFLIVVTTLLLVGAGVYSIKLINSEKLKKILGYLLLIAISAVPAIFATTYLTQFFPNAYNALGTSYWAIVVVAIFSWWSFSIFFKKE